MTEMEEEIFYDVILQRLKDLEYRYLCRNRKKIYPTHIMDSTALMSDAQLLHLWITHLKKQVYDEYDWSIVMSKANIFHRYLTRTEKV